MLSLKRYTSMLPCLIEFIAFYLKLLLSSLKSYITLLYAMSNLFTDISFTLSNNPFFVSSAIFFFSIFSQIASPVSILLNILVFWGLLVCLVFFLSRKIHRLRRELVVLIWHKLSCLSLSSIYEKNKLKNNCYASASIAWSYSTIATEVNI